MAATLIINGNTVINANTDHFGRSASFTTSLSVGATVVNTSSITVQTANITSLVVGSISTSGAGGSSSGFNITGNGSFTGALTAGSIATGGTFSAGNTVFNGTVTLGNILLQNGSLVVGNTSITGLGLTTDNISVRTSITTPTISVTGAAGSLYYQDRANNSVFWTSYVNAGFYRLNLNNADRFVLDSAGNVTTGSIALTTGGIPLQTDSAGNGGLRIVNGGNTVTGYIEFRTPTGTRLGYFGNGPAAGGAIQLAGEGSSYFNFVGNAPQINGNAIYHTGNLNLSGYATTSQLGGYLPTTGGSLSGALTINNSPLVISSANPYIDLVWGGVWRARWSVDGSGNMIYSNGDGGGNKFYVSTGGALWCAQLGDINTRIEQRAAAYADDRSNNSQHGNRWVYAGDLGNDWNYTGGYGTPYNGAAIVDRQTNPQPGFGGQFADGFRWRYLQLYIPAQGWINSYYAS